MSLNQGWTYRDKVPPTAAGLTVLAYYTQHYPHSSQAEWQARIEQGQILLAGCQTHPDAVLTAGQSLAYHRPPWQEPPVPLNVEVLYEDADLLVVAKPSGLPVLPGGHFLEHTLLRQLQRQYPQETPVPIHRLGRGTSGVMLLARSHLAKATLSQQMRQATAQATDATAPRTIQKHYRALVGPSDLPDRFTLTFPIGKVPYPVLGYVYGASPSGRPAYSEGRVLRRTDRTTLVEVTIRTGRPHQIRIHLAAAGYPLLGDPLYGPGGIPLPLPCETVDKLPVPGDLGYHLHAHRLVFTHPRTDQQMDITCPPPSALA